MFRLVDADYSLHQRSFALLDILSHRVQIRRQGNAGREDTLTLLAFALAVELFPPLGYILQFRIVAGQYLGFIPFPVERIPRSGIQGSRILLEWHDRSRSPSHIACSTYQLFYIDPCGRERQQSDRSQYRVTTAHIVRNHESHVALLLSQSPQRTAFGVGHRNDPTCGFGLPVTLLDLLLDNPECHGRFGRCSRFRDNNSSQFVGFYSIEQLIKIILAEVLSGKQYNRSVL